MISAVSGHYGLFEAIRYKRHRQAMLLAEAGIDVDCRNERGQTPLIYTVVAVDDCSRSRTKLVKLFLEAGADPNAADWKGLTALMHASILGQAETIKPLLECVSMPLQKLIDDILDVYVHPYSGAIGDAFVLQDDNVRPHRDRFMDFYLEQQTIQCLQWLT
ncbi:ANK_REP_REGION domain-containing protein [Trichonephila clavipes]|nr:ANK_REP_REGION domain-containing protein [Trichonephila clavipes]